MKKERDENYSHVLKYTGIFGGVQGLNILISLVRNKLIALLLGPQGMGLASLFNTTTNFILLLGSCTGSPAYLLYNLEELIDILDAMLAVVPYGHRVVV